MVMKTRTVHKPYKKLDISAVRRIGFSFFAVILIGSFLLSLPMSHVVHASSSYLDHLFVATSATCVTGLVTHVTCQEYTQIGQIIIILLIQIGGLGFLTLLSMLYVVFKRKLSYANKIVMQEALNRTSLKDMGIYIKRVFKYTATFEGVGAICLMFSFIPKFGISKGIYYSIFHSISAFCNAGFDLLGTIEPYGSLTPYASNIIVNITIMALIIIGGLGFIVWQDIYEKGFKFKKYLLQTKIVLIMTIILIVGGAVLFYLFECQNSLSSLSQEEMILASFFQSVTCRTAGFNTVDVSHLKPSTSLLMMFLMFVGGSPGSTAGGIKTTTFAVLTIFVYATMTNKSEANAFNRRFDSKTIKKACSVFLINLIFIFISAIALFDMQPQLPMQDVFFEIFSALGTVGISTGITRQLTMLSKIVIILLMYCGRVGSLTLALSLSRKKKISNCKNPVEKIAIG